MTERRCDQCRSFEPDEHLMEMGECRIRAPWSGEERDSWPFVKNHEWCDEFEPALVPGAPQNMIERVARAISGAKIGNQAGFDLLDCLANAGVEVPTMSARRIAQVAIAAVYEPDGN